MVCSRGVKPDVVQDHKNDDEHKVVLKYESKLIRTTRSLSLSLSELEAERYKDHIATDASLWLKICNDDVTCGTEKTFFLDFLVILKHSFPNY